MTECVECKCTQDRPCPGGCFWVLPDVCSQCAMRRLVAAGLDATPIVAVQQFMREQSNRVRPFLATELTADIPMVTLASLVNVVTGWVTVTTTPDHPTEFPVTELVADTRTVLEFYDKLAAIGALPSRA